LLACAKAAAPINEICGGDGARDDGVDGGEDGGMVGDGGWDRGVRGVGGVGVGKDSVIEGAIDIRGLSDAGVWKVSYLNSQSISGL
jgi:hypothetical protein